jgi:hypothetical protein
MDTTNEPVAWIDKDGKIFYTNEIAHTLPLYTHPVNPKYDPETGEPLIDGYPLFSGLPHPVKDKPHPKCDEACMYLCQMRELTDEEILQQALFNFGNESENFADSYWIDFARAILRKAKEK